MSAALTTALFFTVALFVTSAYFLLGSVPLLVLKHDTPLDARFVRGFYNTYYLAAMSTAGATALSFLVAGWVLVGAGAAGLGLMAAWMRRSVIPKMDVLRTEIQRNPAQAISTFRRWHLGGHRRQCHPAGDHRLDLDRSLHAGPRRPLAIPPSPIVGTWCTIRSRPVLPGSCWSTQPSTTCEPQGPGRFFFHFGHTLSEDLAPRSTVSAGLTAAPSASPTSSSGTADR